MHHNIHVTDFLKKLKRKPINSDQPDLTAKEKTANDRAVIKFWIQHSKKLEEEILFLRSQLRNKEDDK